MHIYLWLIDPTPLLQSSIDLWKISTQIHYIYIAQCTYTHYRLTPLL